MVNGAGFAGIGAVLAAQSGLPVVTEVLPHSPASSAGMQAQDVIVRVDYRDLAGMKLADVVNLIRGEVGTTVVVTIRHAGESALHDLTIKREPVRVPR